MISYLCTKLKFKGNQGFFEGPIETQKTGISGISLYTLGFEILMIVSAVGKMLDQGLYPHGTCLTFPCHKTINAVFLLKNVMVAQSNASRKRRMLYHNRQCIKLIAIMIT